MDNENPYNLFNDTCLCTLPLEYINTEIRTTLNKLVWITYKKDIGIVKALSSSQKKKRSSPQISRAWTATISISQNNIDN